MDAATSYSSSFGFCLLGVAQRNSNLHFTQSTLSSSLAPTLSMYARWMRQPRFENSVSASDFGNIRNLSNYRLSEAENLVLAH